MSVTRVSSAGCRETERLGHRKSQTWASFGNTDNWPAKPDNDCHITSATFKRNEKHQSFSQRGLHARQPAMVPQVTDTIILPCPRRICAGCLRANYWWKLIRAEHICLLMARWQFIFITTISVILSSWTAMPQLIEVTSLENNCWVMVYLKRSDLNPIQNMWDQQSCCVEARKSVPQNLNNQKAGSGG